MPGIAVRPAGAHVGDRRGIWALVTVPVALFLLLGGLIWAVCAPLLWRRAVREQRSWTRTTATVLEVKERRGPLVSGAAAGWHLRVEYLAGDRRCRSWVDLDGNPGDARARAGTQVNCWFKSEEPDRADLAPPEELPDFRELALFGVAGLALAAGGAWMCVRIVRSFWEKPEPSRLERPEVSPGSRFPFRVAPVLRPRVTLLGYMWIASVWFVALGVTLSLASTTAVSQSWLSRLAGVVFGLLCTIRGVAVSWGAAQHSQAWLRCGVPEVEVDAWPLSEGVAVRIVVRLETRLPLEKLEVHLACAEVGQTARAHRRRGYLHREKTLQLASVLSALGANEERASLTREFQATLAIPAEVAERLRYSAGKFAWKLELTAQLHGIQVIEEVYPLRVEL